MKGTKIPQILRDAVDRSITLWYNKPKYSLLWLHGLGDQSQTFLPFFTHLQSPLYHNCRIKLVQAPKRYITLNQEESNAWFDLKSSQRFTNVEEQVYDLGQLNQTADVLASYCKEEQHFWKEKEPQSAINPQHRVYVGGFSQGAVAALHYSLTTANVPAGVISASGYLLKHSKLNNFGRVPLLLMHGEKDEVVKQKQAKNTYGPLLELDTMVDYHSYPKLGHQMGTQQLVQIKKWLLETHSYITKHYESQTQTTQ